MSDLRRLSDDIDSEIADHLERRVRALRDAGMTETSAREQAQTEFGDLPAARRDLLAIGARIERRRRPRIWSGIGSDVRTAARRLLGQPGATALTILTLALAIGVAAAVFSIIDQLILRPPPFLHADRLVDAWHRNGLDDSGGFPFRPQEIVGWQEQPAVFERFETYAAASFDLTGGERPEPVIALVVSPGLFEMLGIRPLLGRAFTSDDGAPGSEKVAILGHAFWQSRFGGSPTALGSRIVLNDEPYTVIGALPKNTMLLTEDEPVWLPINLRAWGETAPRYGFRGIGRLAPGLDVASARAASDRIAAALGVSQPLPRSWYLSLEHKVVAVVPAETRRVLFVLSAAVCLLLLIACVNVTSLSLGQAFKRTREIELRAAIGASRWRLMREVLVETLLLAAFAGLAAVAVSYGALEALLALAPERFVIVATRSVEIDVRILAMMAAATIGVGLLTGLVPALRSSRINLARSLRESMRGSGRGLSFDGGIGALVVVEVALATVLLVGTALMSRTLTSFYAIEPGFDVERLVTVTLPLPSHRYPTEQARREFFHTLDARLTAHEGIAASAYAWGIPPGPGYGVATPEPEGAAPHSELTYAANLVSPAYFQTTGTAIVAGRPFAAAESRDSVILSQAFARLLWPNEPAVGRRFRESPRDNWLTVVGVAGNVEGRTSGARTPYYAYTPLLMPPAGSGRAAVQPPRSYIHQELIVRAADPSAAVGIIREEIRTLDRNLPVGDFDLGTETYGTPFVKQQFLLTVMGSFAAIALLLAAMGIFGVLSQAVTRRRREIGIRVALGAGSGSLIRMLVGRGVLLASLGAGIGTAASLVGVRTLESLLFGVSPFDAVSFVAVIAVLLTAALAACWWPTRRALAVEPAEVLRSE